MTSNFLADIAEDYKQLYETRENYDVIIYAGEKPNAEEIHAHSLVLRTRSAYFRGALASSWAAKDKDSGCFIFNKPNISSTVFEFILKYLYCGEIILRNQDRETILELLVASDEFGLTKLIDYVQQYFGENIKTHLSQNPIDILHLVAQHDAFNEIRKLSLETIGTNPDILFNSNKYLSLNEDVLILILKHDELEMEESEIWERLIKWGIAQNTSLKDDVTEFDQDDFELLEKTLQKCIQYIRFHEIRMPDFYHKVLPYMPILPNNLFNDILRCYMVPNSVPLYNVFPSRNVNSILINKSHTLLFASWIDKKNNDHYKDKPPYKFVLLFRGSRDGFQNNLFHEKCDQKGATIVVAKIQNSNQLVGGYTPVDWDTSGQNKSSTDSFIFSLSDLTNLSNANLGRISSSYYSYAIYCDKSCGPYFGNGNLHFNRNCINVSDNGYYSNVGIPNGSQIEDYEVFQVIKK
ncbi:hypothetical protein C2G38_1273489 [Gigaspora rosea]|uniref:BTB/POZ domain-containing protein n=1 Tax=Gigaspora rosea TaxID=44941 RepID=A0A397VA69_9GLOM|nr:hypothetical protein C2G38_1273489 [Gigaspora rosea]